MAGHINFTIRDHSDEYSRMSFATQDINDTTYTWADVVTEAGQIATVLDPIIMGTIVRWSYSQDGADVDGDVRPSSPEAQREKAIRVTYVYDVTNKRSSFVIPTADWSLSRQPGTDIVDLTWSLFAAFAAVFNAVVQSPDGNSVTIDKAVNVGRNN